MRLRAALTSDADRLLVDFLLTPDSGSAKRSRSTSETWTWDSAESRSPSGSIVASTLPSQASATARFRSLRQWLGAYGECGRNGRRRRNPIRYSSRRRAARLDYANVYNRILKPAMLKAGITWGGAHRLRHTTATHLIRSGASASQAQLWLGHHDPDSPHARTSIWTATIYLTRRSSTATSIARAQTMGDQPRRRTARRL